MVVLPTDNEGLRTKYQHVLGAFLFEVPDEWFVKLRSASDASSAAIAPIVEAFISNLRSASDVASMPFHFAHSRVLASIWQSIHSAERIRQLIPVEKPDAEEGARDDAALAMARERMDQHLADAANQTQIVARTLDLLEHQLRNSETLARAAPDLNRQAIVMIWGAFEALVTDLCVAAVNLHPERGIELLGTEPARRHLASTISVQELVRHGLDLSSSLGGLIFADRKSETAQLSLQAMRDVVPPLLGADLASPLGSTDLWMLVQQRHLIVHRAGLVDRAFQLRTGSKAEIGTRLRISGTELDRSIQVVTEVACAVISAAGKL